MFAAECATFAGMPKVALPPLTDRPSVGRRLAALRAVLRQGMAADPETTNWSIVWLGFLAAAVADAELIGMHRRNNRAWRQRVERLVAAR